MRLFTPVPSVLVASAILFALAGCADAPLALPNGSQMQVMPPGGSSASTPLKACPKARAYVANFGSNAVTVYPQRGKSPAPCATITTGIYAPASVAVDTKGTVYVAKLWKRKCNRISEKHGRTQCYL